MSKVIISKVILSKVILSKVIISKVIMIIVVVPIKTLHGVNTLAYFGPPSLTKAKNLKPLPPGPNVTKHFTAVIYELS